MDEREALRQALRALILPIDPNLEEQVLDAVQALLAAEGVDPSEQALVVSSENATWREEGIVSPLMTQLVQTCLTTGNGADGVALASNYFNLVDRLQNEYSMSLGASVGVLSHARLVANLARTEGMSGAQLARILEARDRNLKITWQAIHLMLRVYGLAPAITTQQVTDTYNRDAALQELLFADADIGTAIEQLADTASRLGFEGNLAAMVSGLLKPMNDGTLFMPYFLLLHFQCVLAEYYDHALPYLYEFSPRGEAFWWLAEQYPASLLPQANAALNNAKSVQVLDGDWAAAKKPNNRTQAMALVGVLEGLDAMAFLQRRELASWVRAFVHRLIAISAPPAFAFPPEPSAEVFSLFAARLGTQQSGTTGIIEQRAVDAVALALHPDEGWVSRGIGDAVNATNVSRRKLGDCDFQRVEQREAEAYEAHGGTLTRPYVQSHLSSLERVLQRRLNEEWDRIEADPAAWTVTVTFVATNLAPDLADEELDILGVTVRLRYVTVAEFLALVQPQDITDIFVSAVHEQLDQPRVPLRVKQAYTVLVSP